MTERIGFDFRAMQIGHQFRGIGEVVRQGCGQLHARLDASVEFVVFVDPAGAAVDVDELFPDAVRDRRVTVVDYPEPARPRLAKLRSPVTPEREALLAASVDVLVQFDFMLGVPTSVPTVVLMYDQIPLLLGDRFPHNYRPTYRGARRGGMPVKTSVYKAGTRWVYERLLAAALDRAASIVAISEHTARTTDDFARTHDLVGVAAKTHVARLGFTTSHEDRHVGLADLDVMERNRIIGLGIDSTPFVFFMGGSDERRRIDHLVAAFNDVRGRGRELKLVLAGYDFVTVDHVLAASTREALQQSSYLDDIHLLGFISGELRAWLYANAEAYVFPSIHEGFGLPVVESLAVGCPVVTYDNTSIAEVAGPNCVLVPNRWEDLAHGIETILDRDPATKAVDADEGRAWAATFTWDTLGEVLDREVGAALGRPIAR